MRVTRDAVAAFTAEFESEEELRHEQQTNLSLGALLLPVSERLALNSLLQVTLRGPWGGEVVVRGTVVALLPAGMALAIDGHAEENLARLLIRPAEEREEAMAGEPERSEPADAAIPAEDTQEKKQNAWDRVR